MKYFPLLLFALAAPWLSGKGHAAPIISEIVASNESSGKDEDGDASDWLELFNPDPEPVALEGWYLTDDESEPDKWAFPADVILEPGGFLRIWASGKNRTQNPAALHTNFSLSASGEYLALISPQGNVVSAFAPTFPALERDESYGVPFESFSLITKDSTTHVLVPTNDTLGTTWARRDFTPDGSWNSGKAPLGFGMKAEGFYIEERASSGSIATITTAEQVLSGTGATTFRDALRPTVNFTSGGYNDGYFDNGEPALLGSNADHFARRATATLIIPEDGKYTFHVRSDDGFRLRLNGTIITQFSSVRNPGDNFTTRDLTAGEYSLVLTYFNGSGDDELELSAAKVTETTTVVTDAFRLIGDTANGGLAVLAPPNPLLPEMATNLEAAMKNKNASVYVRIPFTVTDPTALETLTLSLAYDDGFVAYLNGVEVARDNAPETLTYNSTATASRRSIDALRAATFNISHARSLLVAGENVLAIHGLNVSAEDGSFLLVPELTASSRSQSTPLFFTTATPGAANPSTGYKGHLATPSFSPERGFYSSPLQVTLTSIPGATIRYTTNGSTPSLTNGATYTGPITVDRTTVIRAAAFREGYVDSPSTTHTYIFLDHILNQPASAPGSGWPSPGTSSGNRMDYAMDPRIVNHANPELGGPEAVKAALQALPSLSLTTDLPNLFHTSTGIYNHATNRGRAWERPASLELIAAPGQPEPGFQANMGIRMRGGYSRSSDNPKHSFRAFFRREYGPGKLSYPLFPNDPTAATEFDKFDIQCSQNYSWSYGTSDINHQHNALREIWARDAQLDLGHPSTRGRFVHLYLNGVYWGLYQIQERAEANWAASYLGGDPDDYDIVKNDRAGAVEATDGYFLTMPDGSDSAWKKLWTATRASYFINSDRLPTPPYSSHTYSQEEKLAAYFKIQGLQADGKTPSGDPVLLDVDNLIDYYILIVLTKNSDSGLSLGGQSPNNFYTAHNRLGDLGFISIMHDAEHSLDARNAAERWGPFDSPTGTYWNNIAYSNPIYFHQDLFASMEYRMRFADRIYQHFFNDGPLTEEANKARLDRRAAEVEPAIIAESARWGDSTSGTPRTIATWRTARDATRNFFTGRSSVYINEARRRGYYPLIDPPVFSQRGGLITLGFQLTLTNPNGESEGVIHYTLDGSDPRPVGGGENGSATSQVYSGPIILNGPVTVKTRVRKGTTWSALNAATFLTPSIPAQASNIVISELHYAPLGPQTPGELGYEGKDFEFIELLNISDSPVDLNGASFTQGITYTFADRPPLMPGERVVLAANPQAFQLRYGGDVVVLGPYSGNLNNAGETIRLVAADGTSVIKEFTYYPVAPWPTTANGQGPSLVLINPGSNPEHNVSASWRASVLPHGSPGTDEPAFNGYASWKVAYGGLEDDADPDHDGLEVLLEYALGGSPATNDRGLHPRATPQVLTVEGEEATYFTFSFTRPAGLEDVEYVVEASSSLAFGSWSTESVVLHSQTPLAEGHELVTYRSAEPVTPNASSYFRLRVRLLP